MDYRKKLEAFNKRELPIILGAKDRRELDRLWMIYMYIIFGMVMVGGIIVIGLDPIY